MMSFKKASNSYNQKDFKSAVEIYDILWTDHRQEFDVWHGWRYANSLNKLKYYERALQVSQEVWKDNPENAHIRNTFCWALYYTAIQIEKVENESNFLHNAETIVNLTCQEDIYSPFTFTVLKVLDHFKEPFNAEIILHWTSLLKPEILDEKVFSYTDTSGHMREKSSRKEEYFALRTKALLKTNQYVSCIELCNLALQVLPSFHYDNDIWFMRRIALSNAKLGHVAEAVEKLKELLLKRREWFIQKEIAEFCYDMGKKDEAMRFALDAAIGHGDRQYKLELYMFLGKLLGEKGMLAESRKHYEFVFCIRNEQGWKIESALTTALESVGGGLDGWDPLNIQERNLISLWEKLKFNEKKKYEGIIDKILPHGKSGFIKYEKTKSVYFKTASFKGNRNLLREGRPVKFYLEDNYDTKKNEMTLIAVNISIE